MDINKYKNDPKWREVMILYSGLFDSPGERVEFIDEIASDNVYLAAECLTSSLVEEENVKNKVIEKSKRDVKDLVNNQQLGAQAFHALVELDQYDDVLPLFSKKVQAMIIPLNQVIFRMLDFYDQHQLEPLTAILSAFPQFYLRTVLDYFPRGKMSEQTFRCIFDLVRNNDKVKTRHLINLLKLKPKEVSLNLDQSFADRLLINVETWEELAFVYSWFNLKYDTADMIDSRMSHRLTVSNGFIVFRMIDADKWFRKNKLNQFIHRLLSDKNPADNAFAVVLIYYFGRLNNFIGDLNKVHTKAMFRLKSKETLREVKGFSRAFLESRELFGRYEYVTSVSSYVGKTFRLKVVAQWRYHYVLASPASIKGTSLLPFMEAEGVYQVGEEINVVVIFVNREGTLFCFSEKQVGKFTEQLKWRREYLFAVKIGDMIDCEIRWLDGKYKIKAIGLGKKLQCALEPGDFNYTDEKRNYKTAVVQVISTFYVKVKVIDD